MVTCELYVRNNSNGGTSCCNTAVLGAPLQLYVIDPDAVEVVSTAMQLLVRMPMSQRVPSLSALVEPFSWGMKQHLLVPSAVLFSVL